MSPTIITYLRYPYHSDMNNAAVCFAAKPSFGYRLIEIAVDMSYRAFDM
jgi:hypothetical protein